MAETFVRPVKYEVSVWPPGIECIDSATWKLDVECRGRGLWAVSHMSMCLSADGEWDREMRPSGREDDWLAAHCFPLAEALELARRHAPGVTVNGMTAAWVLARHRDKHPGGCDD